MKSPSKYLLVATLLFFLLNCKEKPLLTNKEQTYLNENAELIVAVYINYPPYQFVNTDGGVDGILIDYFNTIENKINYRFKKKYYSNWQTLLNDASEGKSDVLLEIQETKDRQEYLIFTEPIFVGDHVIISKKDSQFINLKKLENKKVAVVDEYSIEEHLKDHNPELELIAFKNEKECLEALDKGEVDAFIALESSANYFIKKGGFSDIKIQEAIHFENELGIAINKNKPILASIINKANTAITLEEKNEIIDKWLYNVVKPFHKKITFWEILLGIVAFILLLSFLFSYYLKREVEKRTEELKKAKQVAERSNELKTLFLQNISHEVRTPLNSITGFANFLKETNLEKEDTTHFIDTIVQQSSNLTNILNNVIEISELTTTKPTPKKNLLCLEKEFNILAEIYKVKAEYKNLNFNYNNSIKKPNSYIFSDKSRLIKAISNLLDNAIKFTEKGSITLYSTIKDQEIIIRIIDTGIGIHPDKAKAVFHEFYQVEKKLSKKHDGLGIGLTTAKQNIKSIGGNLTLDNSNEKVTSFIITLPYNPVDKFDSIVPKAIDSKFKILIAEDMKLNYLVLQKMLDNIVLNDKEIIWAKNGQEALDYVKNKHFDIIFMDLKMPVLDGYQATEQIKALYPEIPIIAQTAYTLEENYNKAMSIGFDAYLTKPINSSELKIILQDYYMIKITSD